MNGILSHYSDGPNSPLHPLYLGLWQPPGRTPHDQNTLPFFWRMQIFTALLWDLPASIDPRPPPTVPDAESKKIPQYPNTKATTDAVDHQTIFLSDTGKCWEHYKAQKASYSIRITQMEYRRQFWAYPPQWLELGCTRWPNTKWKTSGHLSVHPPSPLYETAGMHPSGPSNSTDGSLRTCVGHRLSFSLER